MVRQKGIPSEKVKIIDMSKKPEESEESVNAEDKDREGEHKATKKHKHKRKKEKKGEMEIDIADHLVLVGGGSTSDDLFNPFLQELALRLSNKTRAFTFTNE